MPDSSSDSAQARQDDNLSLWEYYVKCLKNYANFKGRARRKEFWGFFLFNFIIAFALSFIGGFISGITTGNAEGTLGVVLYYLYSFAVFLPSLGVFVRRMHDIGKSGWAWFWVLLPIVGWIFILKWLCTKSNDGLQEGSENAPSLQEGFKKRFLMNKWVGRAILAVMILILTLMIVSIVKFFGSVLDEAKATIVPLNLNEWAQLQRAYFSQHNKVGSNKDIGWGGYSDPNNLNDKCKEKKCFSFYSDYKKGIEFQIFNWEAIMGEASFCAENNENIGSCKAGNKWCIKVAETKDGKGSVRYIEPEDKSCIKLTPANLFLK